MRTYHHAGASDEGDGGHDDRVYVLVFSPQHVLEDEKSTSQRLTLCHHRSSRAARTT